MTRVKLFFADGHIVAVESKGHTGYAESGKDIVCAAVSAIVQTALLGLVQVAKAEVKKTTREGYLKFAVVTNNDDERKAADVILATMRLAVKDLQSGYPSHIKLEEIENVY
ncbi:MAG: ribosomal-processing cysteine protease Prp [Clostridia bacterium]